MVSIISTLASGRLIVFQVRWPLQPLYDFEDWLAVERQVDAELRIPFPNVVCILTVEGLGLLRHVLNVALHLDNSPRSAMNVKW